MLTLADILDQQRSLYIDEFKLRAGGFAQDLASILQPEALYCLPDGNPVRTGSLKLPARGDLCVKREGRVVELARIEAPRALSFEPFQFVWADTLQVALHPFAWDDCRVCIPEPMLAVDWPLVGQWFESQIGLDTPYGEAGTLINAVHSMSEPGEAADGVRFEIDFGSAGVEAFESFLSQLATAGAGLVVIGQLTVPGAK